MTKTMRGCNTDETGLALANVAKKPLFPGNKKKKKLLGPKCRYCDNCLYPGEGRDLVSTLERRLVMNIVKGHRSPNLQLFSTHQHNLTICSLGRPGNWKFTQLA